MKYPKTINIGNKVYKIKVLKFLERFWFLKHNMAANINYKDNLIKTVEFDDPKENEANLFHEITHGILREMEFNHPGIITYRNNEVFVEELGLALRKTFIDLHEKGVLDNKRI